MTTFAIFLWLYIMFKDSFTKIRFKKYGWSKNEFKFHGSCLTDMDIYEFNRRVTKALQQEFYPDHKTLMISIENTMPTKSFWAWWYKITGNKNV